MKQTKADDEWSLAVKIRAGFKCEYCFGTVALNSHHFISRSVKQIRYDVNNGFSLCANHHINYAHKRPSEFVSWAIKTRGELWHNLLLIKSRTPKLDVTLDLLYCKQLVQKYKERK